jgi:serine/threonine protein kinase
MQSGPASSTDDGLAPPRVPGFDLLRLIGQGSAGRVWLAEHMILEVFRAVKVVRRDASANRVATDKELEGIRHFEPVSRQEEGLVDITDVGSLPEQPGFYYAMELADDANGPPGEEGPSVPGGPNSHTLGPVSPGPAQGNDQGRPRSAATTEAGAAAHHAQAPAASPGAGPVGSETTPLDVQHYVPRTLAGEVSRRGRLSAQETIDLGLRLARTLDFLHSRKLVHRDIKPQNILFVGGKPKLADPGLMTLVGEHTTCCGTTGYIPPEGQGAAQADLYSLGKTLYTISTGRLVIELSTRGPAIVRSRSADAEAITLCDLGSLPAWHLEIRSHAAAADRMHNSASRVAIDQVRIVSAPQQPRLAGYVTNILSGLPMSSIRVRNRTTGDAWTTGRDGAYAVDARAGHNELEAIAPNLTLHSGATLEWMASGGFVEHHLGVSRDPPALGDALDVIRLGRGYEAKLAFRAGLPLVTDGGRLVELALDGRSSRVLADSYPGAGMTCVGQQVFAVGTHRGNALFELLGDGKWEARRQLPTLWAAGITHDGKDFWICQNDRAHGDGPALYRWNHETGATVEISTDLPDVSPVWHKGRLWVLTATGRVFEVDRERAVETRRLELACRPAFETPCRTLASDGTGLWGLGPNGQTLHRLYVP